MAKISDSITTVEELDELTNYLVDPKTTDSIVEIATNYVETEKMIVTFSSGVAKEAEQRMIDVVSGEIEWVEDVVTNNDDTFEFKPTEILTVEGIQVNLY